MFFPRSETQLEQIRRYGNGRHPEWMNINSLPFFQGAVVRKFIEKPQPDFPLTLGGQLKRKRFLLGLTQRDVARSLGVNEWTYRDWEQDNYI